MGRKLKYVLSDLHIGAGHIVTNDNRSEGFPATKEFIAFLHEIWQESEREEREIELIINGDFFSFLQVPAVDKFNPLATYSHKDYQDSSQEASIKRLNIIVKSNPGIFNALADFIHVGPPQCRITIIKGNHDVSLFWPGVKTRLREIVGASGIRASLLRFADEFVSREKIYVEHGHQRAEKMNGYHDSFDPRAAKDPNQLDYPAGSLFTIDFLNDAKQKLWFVDHIKPVTTLIWYGFHWNFDFACQALASFIRHTPALVVSNFDMEDSDSGITSRTHLLLYELENEERRGQLYRKYTDDPEFRKEFHRRVQQYLDDATVDNKGESILQFGEISEDPLKMGFDDQRRQQLMLRQAAKRIASQEKAKIILFGHTHYCTREELDNDCIYINTGSWIEDFSDASERTWEALFDGTINPGSTRRVLPYTRIEYDDQDNPSVELLYFGETAQISPEATLPQPENEDSPPPIEAGFFQQIFRRLQKD